MCWYTWDFRNMSPRTAPKGGLKVYKVTLLSEQDCKSSDYKKCNSFTPLVYRAFTYYKDCNNPFINIRVLRCETGGGSISEGYHSYIDKDSMGIVDEATRIIGEFLIPSGTKYFVNEMGEVVSEKLIFKRYIPYVNVNHTDVLDKKSSWINTFYIKYLAI